MTDARFTADDGPALVGEGQTAIAGETVIADLRVAEPARAFSVG